MRRWKKKITREYLRKTIKLLVTKLHRRNLIKGTNTWAVPFVRYSRPFLKWTREELQQMDQRTRKLMTMHNVLHPREDVDSLYVKEGGRGLASIRDIVDASIQQLENYTKKRGGRLNTATRNNTDNPSINRTEITRKQKWEEKQVKLQRESIS